MARKRSSSSHLYNRSRCKRQNKETDKMTDLGRISLLNLPDETIEEVTFFLPFEELIKLRKLGSKRLEDCAKRTLKKKSYIAIIGGYNNGDMLDDVEVISIKKNSILRTNTFVPSLPKRLVGLRGTQLPNHDLLVSGGDTGTGVNDEYLRFNHASSLWKKVGTMQNARYSHSSVLLNGCLYSCGGFYSPIKATSHHEAFSLDGGVNEKRELPIALSNHSANKLNESQYMVIGGSMYKGNNFKKSKRSQKTFIYDSLSDNWKEGPSLLSARSQHCSCVIQSVDGTSEAVIVIGGLTNEGKSSTTEIFKIGEKRWIQGPPFPSEIDGAACVPLFLLTNFACLVVGGETEEYTIDAQETSDVYGLDRSWTGWTHIGKIKKGRQMNIVLALS